jgi:hypothetical protein
MHQRFAVPWHGFPPCCAAGLSHSRACVASAPSPHVAEHAPQAPQRPSTACGAGVVIVANQEALSSGFGVVGGAVGKVPAPAAHASNAHAGCEQQVRRQCAYSNCPCRQKRARTAAPCAPTCTASAPTSREVRVGTSRGLVVE